MQSNRLLFDEFRSFQFSYWYLMIEGCHRLMLAGAGQFSRRLLRVLDILLPLPALFQSQNPRMVKLSFNDDEVVEFDGVDEDRGRKAANATEPSGEPVEGSPHVACRCHLRSRQSCRGRQHRAFLNAQCSPSVANVLQELGPHFWQPESHQREIFSNCRGQCEVGKHYEYQKGKESLTGARSPLSNQVFSR